MQLNVLNDLAEAMKALDGKNSASAGSSPSSTSRNFRPFPRPLPRPLLPLRFAAGFVLALQQTWVLRKLQVVCWDPFPSIP